MPVFKITEVKHVSQLHDTMVLLRWLLQIFSMDSGERRISKSEKRSFIIKGVVSAIIVGAFDFYCLYWKSQNIFKSLNSSIVITDVIQMIYDYGQYIVDLCVIYKYGREVSQVYFKNYMCIDKILDTSHHDEIQSKLIRLTMILLFCLIIVSAFDYTAWYLGYGFWTPIFYSISYFFLLFKVLTNLDLTVQIMHVECRLRDIGDLLQDTYNSTECLPIPESMKENNQTLSNSLTNKNWFYGGGCLRAEEMRTRNHPWKKATTSCHEMKWLTRCYLLINEQCMFINRMFGVRILLNSLSLLIDMVRFLNVVVRITVGSVKTHYNDNSGYLPAMSTFLRFLICVFILASLVYHCERAYAQTTRIISVTDHILVNRNPDEALRSSLTELRGLVSSRPISFNMANFFQLSYPFLTSMISVVVTYTIILLQSL
ncbi:hypothetical protein O0L34_g10382 [Tuta absoluta]|nr:hypothetical protein O0L34_g10382 [Tuta absoluta]